jgi:hypothetical protein
MSFHVSAIDFYLSFEKVHNKVQFLRKLTHMLNLSNQQNKTENEILHGKAKPVQIVQHMYKDYQNLNNM